MATAIVAESCYDPRSDEVEAVDARLVALARGGAPLRRALARVAGELVRRRACLYTIWKISSVLPGREPVRR